MEVAKAVEGGRRTAALVLLRRCREAMRGFKAKEHRLWAPAVEDGGSLG